MKRSQLILFAVLVVAVAAFFGVRELNRSTREREVRATLLRYNEALAQAVRTFDPEKLDPVALPNEKVRVSSYITGLWGEDIALETRLLSLRILDIRSAEPTITVVAEERWLNTKRVRSTGEVTKQPTEETQKLRYTLLRDGDGVLKVYVSRLFEEGGIDE